MIVVRFEFHQNRLSSFGAVGCRNLPIPIDLTIGLYNSLYYRTSRDGRSAVECKSMLHAIYVRTPPHSGMFCPFISIYSNNHVNDGRALNEIRPRTLILCDRLTEARRHENAVCMQLQKRSPSSLMSSIYTSDRAKLGTWTRALCISRLTL